MTSFVCGFQNCYKSQLQKIILTPLYYYHPSLWIVIWFLKHSQGCDDQTHTHTFIPKFPICPGLTMTHSNSGLRSSLKTSSHFDSLRSFHHVLSSLCIFLCTLSPFFLLSHPLCLTLLFLFLSILVISFLLASLLYQCQKCVLTIACFFFLFLFLHYHLHVSFFGNTTRAI